jgi:hypothetical protein
MAYHLHHRTIFYNCLNEKLLIELYKKDIEPDEVTDLMATSFSVQYPIGEGDKFDTIISCEARLTLFLQNSDDQTFEDFIVTFPDEWKMIAYDDDEVVFAGFLTPGEGRAEFQDKPYDVTLSAVDGLGLLKGVPLTNDDSENFTGVNLIIDYILAILNKTGLDLNLRLFSSIIEESMEDRTQNPNADTFNQTGLHARTFLKSATEFYDCYTCLERILSEYFCLYQWYGKWVILRIGELQDSPGAKIWFTEYDSDGAIVDAVQSAYNAAAVGRDRLVHPVEVSQFIGSNFAVKSTRYTYNYTPWPEIPANNVFERGTLIPGVEGNVYEVDNNGDDTAVQIGTYTGYTIDDWTFGSFGNSLPALDGAIDSYYKKVTVNSFGDELNREIVINKSTTVTQVLQSDAIPVKIGDRFSFSFEYKLSFNMSLSSAAFRVAAVQIYIVPIGGGALWWWRDGAGITNLWRRNPSAAEAIFIEYAEDSDEKTKIYKSKSLESNPIPVEGTAYVQLLNVVDNSMPNSATFRNVKLEYIPFIAGGYLRGKGDFSQTSQNDNFQDIIDEEVFISDSPKQVLQGALYRENLTDLTTPTWHRFNVEETRHFKEIGELARFNNNYRRMWKIDGQFDGLKYTPVDNGTVLEPLSFHRQFTFPDSTILNGRYFVLVPPLSINYSEGRADMNFIEVLEEGSEDGNNTGDNHIPLQYIFG